MDKLLNSFSSQLSTNNKCIVAYYCTKLLWTNSSLLEVTVEADYI